MDAGRAPGPVLPRECDDPEAPGATDDLRAIECRAAPVSAALHPRGGRYLRTGCSGAEGARRTAVDGVRAASQTPAVVGERKALLEAEVARLQAELATLERQWDRKHRLMLFGLAAIPAYLLFGGLVAAVVLLCTPALVATQAYLLYVRRMECRQLIDETRREIDRLDRADEPSGGSAGAQDDPTRRASLRSRQAGAAPQAQRRGAPNEG